ncbi:MAG: hypothetical protein LBS45_09110 [Synergistaceae bacterium]|jgi:hypothetical protein|nr:hypothetical protein [Synergistaceae bacterium]
MFLAGSQGKKAAVLLTVVSFLLLQVSVMLVQTRAPGGDMSPGVSSYLLVADMSNDSVCAMTATNRSGHRMAADSSGDFAGYGVSLWKTAEISDEKDKNHTPQGTAQNLGLALEAQFNVVSRK